MRLLDGTPIKYQKWTALVPPMTHELSSEWDQPDPNGWAFDDTHVVMPEADFKALREYSASIPTGVYEGKMWRRVVLGYDDRDGAGLAPMVVWYLMWYGDPIKDRCPIHSREILLVPT